MEQIDLKPKITGNILLFYAFDVGEDIDGAMIQQKNLIPTYTTPQSHYFKDYHVPVSFRLIEQKDGTSIERQDCISSKVNPFGVISLCYKIPFNDYFEQLKSTVIEAKEKYDKQSDLDAKMVFDLIAPAIKKSHFYNLKNDYFAVHVNPIEKISAHECRETYGGIIASTLRLETLSLSEYQQNEILRSTVGYYGQDFMIIDSEASFIYDTEYFEPMEFFDSINIQQLELQYYDRLLDRRLNEFYAEEQYKIPLRAYIPLIGRRFELPVSKLARMRVDISVVTERLENSIKMTGDAYYLKLYLTLVEKLSLREWRDSINRKLSIVGDLYEVHQNNLDTIHEEMMTVVIIILIAFEAIMAFVR